jgi:hypothetical protein
MRASAVTLSSENHLLTRSEAVREQLEKILSHPTFKNSQRSANLLRFVVEYSLRPDSDQIKERTLGVEVFGRSAGYDTQQDSVVRHTASEVRKRIALYYHEPGHETEIRIDLPPGSYVPEFHFPVEMPAESQSTPPEAAQASLLVPKVASLPRKMVLTFAAVATMLIILTTAGISWRFHSTPKSSAPTKLAQAESTRDLFWKPFLAPKTPVLLCVGNPQPEPAPLPNESDVLEFALNTAQWTKFLTQINKDYQIKDASSTTFVDMRQEPTILVGGFDNSWSLRALEKLPYRIARDADSAWIENRKDPSNRQWLVNLRMRNPKSTEDYAIVARYIDPYTGRWVMIATGLNESGTSAASTFLTDPAALDDLAKLAPANWISKNVEAVVMTPLVDGNFGRTSVLKVEVW